MSKIIQGNVPKQKYLSSYIERGQQNNQMNENKINLCIIVKFQYVEDQGSESFPEWEAGHITKNQESEQQ